VKRREEERSGEKGEKGVRMEKRIGIRSGESRELEWRRE
jgi:hypothetical protein